MADHLEFLGKGGIACYQGVTLLKHVRVRLLL